MKSTLNSVTCVLLLPLLFVHWAGDAVSAVYIALLFLLAAIFRLRTGGVPKKALNLMVLLLLYLAAVIVINRVTAPQFFDFSAAGHLKLSYQATIFFMVIILVTMLPRLSKHAANRLFDVYYLVMLTTICGEWVLVNMLGVSNTLMPTYQAALSYSESFRGIFRPFGLTGNASVNGSMLVAATWIMILHVRPARAKYYLPLTLLALVLNNSGQALLAFFITCALYLAGRYRGAARYLAFAIITCAICGFIYSGVFEKLSLDYLLNINQYWLFGIFGGMDITRIIFGGYSFYKEHFSDPRYYTEFYPVYAMSRFGLLMTFATWGYLWSKLPRKGRAILFAALFFGSIHYGSILYIPLLVLLAVLIVNREPTAPARSGAAQ